MEEILRQAFQLGQQWVQDMNNEKEPTSFNDWFNSKKTQEQVKNCSIPVVSESFKVQSYSFFKKDDVKYCHWSKGLKMILTKNGQKIEIEGDECKKITEALPRTFGGGY